MKSKTIVSVYTDGSHESAENKGGYGIVMTCKGHIKKISSVAYVDTTNNRMELKAIIHALEHIKPGWIIDIYSDSQYCINSINQYLENWLRKGKLDEMKNPDLWYRFLNAKQKHHEGGSTLNFTWVRGHNGNTFNEMADRLANLARTKKNKVVCTQNN